MPATRRGRPASAASSPKPSAAPPTSPGSRGSRHLVVGVVALLFGARALLKVLRIVYGLVWGVTPGKLKRPALAMLGVLGLTTVRLRLCRRDRRPGRAVDRARPRRRRRHVASFRSRLTVVASWYLPRQPDAVAGARFPARSSSPSACSGLHIVTVYWIAREVESKTDTYGAIGAALALLLWSYLLGRLITASAVINASLWQRRKERAERRAACARMHRASPGHEGRQGYTPTARPESAPSTAVRREGTDGRAEPRS